MHGQWAYVLKDTHTHNYYYNLLFQPIVMNERVNRPNVRAKERRIKRARSMEVDGGEIEGGEQVNGRNSDRSFVH